MRNSVALCFGLAAILAGMYGPILPRITEVGQLVHRPQIMWQGTTNIKKELAEIVHRQERAETPFSDYSFRCAKSCHEPNEQVKEVPV